MNKLISMALVLATATTLTAGCAPAYQNQSAATAPATTCCGTKSFEAHKAKILNRINERQTRIQQIENCVKAANNSQELKACRPKEHHGHHHHDK